jgi:NAD(P)-dependent dehydrogenase (short-subunit alcohol dehydrogenase family)
MSSWHSLAGKTIWVAGGAGYLGSAITRELDREGAKVLCIDLPGNAEALVAREKLTHTIPVACNLADPAVLPAFVADAIAKHGVPDGHAHLTFASSAGKRLEELSAADFQSTLDQSLPAAFVLCRALADAMKPLGRGSVVLFSSMYGVVSPDPRIYHAPMAPNPIDYGAAKAALLQISRYFAVHYGPAGVRFNCITPGPFPNPAVQTGHPAFIGDLAKKTALNRVGQSPEIVGPTLFLLSDGASFVTGHTLAVDGGWTAW